MNNCPKTPGIKRQDRHGLGRLRSEGPCVHRPRDVGLGQGGCKCEFGSPAPQHTSHAVLPAGHVDSVHCKGPHACLFPDFTEDPHPECSVTPDRHNDHRSEMELAVTGLASAPSGEGASLLLGGEGAAAPQGGGSSCRDVEEARGGASGGTVPPPPCSPAVSWGPTPDTPDTCIGCSTGREGGRRGGGARWPPSTCHSRWQHPGPASSPASTKSLPRLLEAPAPPRGQGPPQVPQPQSLLYAPRPSAGGLLPSELGCWSPSRFLGSSSPI